MGRYVRIAKASEIPKDKMRIFKAAGHEILVVNVKGGLHAFENRCPHMGYPLYLGSLEGKLLSCGFHYAKFDVTTGKSLGPVTDKPLKLLKIKVQGSIVKVEL